jgi:hypothetical protein
LLTHDFINEPCTQLFYVKFQQREQNNLRLISKGRQDKFYFRANASEGGNASEIKDRSYAVERNCGKKLQ